MIQINKKNSYIMLAMILVIFAPIIVLLTPILITVVFFDEPSKIVFITFGKSFVMYTLTFAIAFCVLTALFSLKSLFAKVIMLMISLLGMIFIYLVGAGHYVYLTDYTIEYNPLFGQKVSYEWDELAKVSHELTKGHENEKYIFEFRDGYSFDFSTVQEMDSFTKSRLYQKLMQLDISFEEY